MKVLKNNGSTEPFSPAKYLEMLTIVTQGIEGVSKNDLFNKSRVSFRDGMTSLAIHKATTDTAIDMSSIKTIGYDNVAGRCVMVDIVKQAYGSLTYPTLASIIDKNHKDGYYEDIAAWYSEDETNMFDKHIDHGKDMDFGYKAIVTFRDKYLVTDELSHAIETPQVLFMLVAMLSKRSIIDREARAAAVIEFYNDMATFKLSIPTPIMAGLRTRIKGYASCCKIEMADNKDSIKAAQNILIDMGSKRTGIGISGVNIRSEGSPISNGLITHTGIGPVARLTQGSVHAFSQGSRNNSATFFKQLWDMEIGKVLRFKSNKTNEAKAIAGLHYGIIIPGLIFTRAQAGEKFTLFDAKYVPLLMENLGNEDEWIRQYIRYENTPGIRKKEVDARTLLEDYAREYFEIGRLYPLFIFNANKYTPLKDAIRMSNLCMEIFLHTKPVGLRGEGEVPLCILGNLNAGKVSIDEIERLAYSILSSVDAIIDLQEYENEQVERAMMGGRYVAIGVSDWMHYLALNQTRYNEKKGMELAREFAERLQYSLLKASVRLAKEKGEAPWFRERSKYADGWLPNQGNWKYVTTEELDELQVDMAIYGMRNLTVSGIPPAATSSDVSWSLPSIDFPLAPATGKTEATSSTKQFVPDYDKCKDFYVYVDDADMEDYLRHIAEFQKYMDQGISVTITYTEKDLDDEGKLSLYKIIKLLYLANKLGLKSLYYLKYIPPVIDHEKMDDWGTVEVTEDEEECVGGACKI